MTDTLEIQRDIRAKVSEEVTLQPHGIDRFRVMTPFRLNDGDHIVVVLRREGNQWVFSDEGNTYMKLTYRLDERDFRDGNRAALIETALGAYHVEDRGGELIAIVPDGRFGDALFSFVQAVIRISDVEYLSRDRARTTFLEDVRTLLRERVPSARIVEEWHHPARDPERKYLVDYYVNGQTKPLLIFALPTDDKVKDATITLLRLESWDVRFTALGIFEDQERIQRRALAKFTDVCQKQYSSLSTAKERLDRFLEETIESQQARRN